MTDSSDKAREEFFSEAQEIVEELGRDLLALDEGHRGGRVDPDVVNDVFRAVHTLKGLAGLFGANRISLLSHALEELLDDLRLGRAELSSALLNRLFSAVEVYGKMLQHERLGQEEPLPELDELLRLPGRDEEPAGEEPPAPDDYDLDPGLLAVLTEYEEHRLRTNIAQGLSLFRLRVQFELATVDQDLDLLKQAAKPHGEIITYLPTGAGGDADSIELDIVMASRSDVIALRGALARERVVIEELPRRARRAASRSLSPAPSATPSASPSYSAAPSRVPPQDRARGGASGSLRSVAQTVRVDIKKLDQLMNVVGELALVRSALLRVSDRIRATVGDRSLMTELQRVHRAFERQLSALQSGILEVRMVPLGQVFDKLARVVRQISGEADKRVNLVITGAETEVDKLIIEELSDPLMHMMRNAVDHGIESAVERERVGKPPVGTVALNAFQKGNHVVIEIEDDGAGVNLERLVESAVARGALTAEEARELSQREVLNLVFQPGVSTKADVSQISGRGVGMDVVKTNIAKLGGVVDLQSEPGIGTKVIVTMPITLAIVSALLVKVREQTFAVPLANISEAIAHTPGEARLVDGRGVITLRGGSLPTCDLAAHLGIEGASPRRAFVVVASVGARRLGLIVDQLLGEQDIVIKALGPSLRGVRGFAGATELGDQRIALVIDAPALVDEVPMAAGERPLKEASHG